MRVPIFDSRGKVIGSEPAPQRYCSEEEQRRIRADKAKHNYFYSEGYDDGSIGAQRRYELILVAQDQDSADAYWAGYRMGAEDAGKCPYCDEDEHTGGWGAI